MEMKARCPSCGRRQRRSSDANARYWALLHVLSERVRPSGTLYSVETWHTYCKSRWLGCDEIVLPAAISNPASTERAIPRLLLIPRSTADLEVDAFSDYMTQVEAWCADKGVFLPDEA